MFIDIEVSIMYFMISDHRSNYRIICFETNKCTNGISRTLRYLNDTTKLRCITIIHMVKKYACTKGMCYC